MPRKERMPKRRREDELNSKLIDILLTGECEADPFYWFDVDLLEDGGFLLRLWRTHREALLREAERRKIHHPWGVTMFDHLDRTGDE